MSLTGIRDLDLEILRKLDDRELINFCMTEKAASRICAYEPFWMNRLNEKYPNAKKYFRDYSIMSILSIVAPGSMGLQNLFANTWREYYLQTVYYVNKMKEDFDFEYKTGNPRNYYIIFYGIKYPHLKMQIAAQVGYIDLLEYFIKNDNNYIYSNPAETSLFQGAAQGNQIDVIYHFWKDPMPVISANSGLVGAVLGRNVDLLKFFINKGANDIQGAMGIATTTRDKEIISELKKHV